MSSLRNITYKICIAGDGGVGKTTLLHRFVEGSFIIDTKMTIGVGFFLKHVDLGDGNIYGLQLWDFGGEEHFRPFLDTYANGASGGIVVYDRTRMKTLNNIQTWVKILRKEDPNLPIIFLGSKSDLSEQISVGDDYAKEFVDQFGFIDHLNVSSKSGQNVEEAFKRLTREVIKYIDEKS